MRPIAAVWQRLPIMLRAVVVGSLVVGMGTVPRSVLMSVNFKLWPAIPWSVPVMALYLWFYWQYVGGKGWPQTTAEWRRTNLRARSLTGRVWRSALLAGGLGWAGLLALRIFSDTFFRLPQDQLPDLSAYPFATILSHFLMISVVAGFAEEAGFRGYMQWPIEQRHGPLVAIAVVGLVFWLAHFANYIGREWLFVCYLPFYLAGATIFGVLAYFTGSILPGVVLHTAANVVGLSLIWGWDSLMSLSGISRYTLLLITGPAGILFAVSAIRAYRRLATVVRSEQANAI